MISLSTSNWTIENIDTVLFDKDGTFIDLHYFWGRMTELRADAVINNFNLEKSCHSELCLFLGYDSKTGRMLKDGITALYSRVKIIEIFKKDLEKYNIYTTEDVIADIFDKVSKLFYENMTEYTKPIGSAILFIKKLKEKGITTGIVTSDSKESTLLTLKHFGWENLFDVVIGRECTESPKESGEPTKLALKILNANPKTTVMIGDAPMDYLTGIRAGIESNILVATGQISCKELELTSKYVVESLKDVTIY